MDSIFGDGNYLTVKYVQGNSTASHVILSSIVGYGTIFPAGTVVVDSGGKQTFTVTPNSGWHIDSIVVDGQRIDSLTSYTFYNVVASHTIKAVFVPNNIDVAMSIAPHWNMISLPVNVAKDTVSCLFPDMRQQCILL